MHYIDPRANAKVNSNENVVVSTKRTKQNTDKQKRINHQTIITVHHPNEYITKENTLKCLILGVSKWVDWAGLPAHKLLVLKMG